MSNFIRFGRVEVVAGPDAEQDVVRLGLVLADVVEVVGHDERQAGLRREPEELLVEPALLGHAVVLELEVEAVLAEDVAVLAGEVAGQLPVLDLERLGDLAAEARRQPDQALAVAWRGARGRSAACSSSRRCGRR